MADAYVDGAQVVVRCRMFTHAEVTISKEWMLGMQVSYVVMLVFRPFLAYRIELVNRSQPFCGTSTFIADQKASKTTGVSIQRQVNTLSISIVY